MSNAQGAINTIAVFDRGVGIVVLAHVVFVTLIAHKVSSEAMEQGCAAAKHALPVYLCFTVFITNVFPCADFFENTILAHKIFGIGLALLYPIHLLLAVYQASKVGLFAPMALIEGASMICKLLRLAEVNVVFIGQALIIENALILGIYQGLFLYDLLKAEERAKLGCDRIRQSLQLDFLLATWARHESKCDAESCPFVFEELDHTVCVKYVAA